MGFEMSSYVFEYIMYFLDRDFKVLLVLLTLPLDLVRLTAPHVFLFYLVVINGT